MAGVLRGGACRKRVAGSESRSGTDAQPGSAHGSTQRPVGRWLPLYPHDRGRLSETPPCPSPSGITAPAPAVPRNQSDTEGGFYVFN
uniref:Uncharacterized protein n=1 Tax=Human herpesvirus 2 TaxID=10310 RepID=A0A481TJU7_HHV2|nr:hypothetical protein [Human alphaherpesvirus 2]